MSLCCELRISKDLWVELWVVFFCFVFFWVELWVVFFFACTQFLDILN